MGTIKSILRQAELTQEEERLPEKYNRKLAKRQKVSIIGGRGGMRLNN